MTATHKNVNEDIRDEGDVEEEYTLRHTAGPEKAVRTGLDNVPLKGSRQ